MRDSDHRTFYQSTHDGRTHLFKERVLPTKYDILVRFRQGVPKSVYKIRVLTLGEISLNDVDTRLCGVLSPFSSPHAIEHKEANSRFGGNHRAPILIDYSLQSDVAHSGVIGQLLNHEVCALAFIFARLPL
jgi:hypothetical protein